jgi:phosphatidylglycerophosphatase A
VALIAVPLAWKSFLAGFILFRAFDIVKPPPVRQLEAIPEGAGIVLDDIAAGLYALVVVHLFLHFGLLRVVRVFSSWDFPIAFWARKT